MALVANLPHYFLFFPRVKPASNPRPGFEFDEAGAMEGAKSAAKSMRALADLGDSVRSSTSSGAGDLIDMFGEC